MEQGTMEETILNQVGAVFSGQAFPLYLRNQAPFILKTAGVVPGPIGRLGHSTELEVFSDMGPREKPSHETEEIQSCVKPPFTDEPATELVDGEWGWLRLLEGDSELYTREQFVGTLNLPDDMTKPQNGMAKDAGGSEKEGGMVEVQSLITTSCLMCERSAQALGIGEGDVVCVESDKEVEDGEVSDKVQRLMMVAIVSPLAPLGHLLVTSAVRKCLEVDVFEYVRVKLCRIPDDGKLGGKMGLHPVSFHEKSSENDQGGGKKSSQKTLEGGSGRMVGEANGPLKDCQIDSLKPVLKSFITAWVSSQLEIARRLSSRDENLDRLAIHSGSIVHMAVKSVEAENLGSRQEFIYLIEINKGAQNLDFPVEDVCLLSEYNFLEAVRSGASTVTIEKVFSIEKLDAVAFPTELACLTPPPWLNDELEGVAAHVRPSLSPDPILSVEDVGCDRVWPTGVLVTGSRGSGRTSFVSGLARAMYLDAQIHASVQYVSFNDVPVDKPASGNGGPIRSFVSHVVTGCLEKSPGIVIFDDLDVVCPASNTEERAANDAESSTLAVWMVDAIQCATNGRPIVFVATCESLDGLSEELRSSGLLGYHVSLPAHNSVSRSDIFAKTIKGQGGKLSGMPLKDISVWGTGYEAGDLVTLADRTVRQHLVEKMRAYRPDESSRKGCAWAVGEGDIQKARDGFKPAAFWDASDDPGQSDIHGWEDVGGLHAVRAVLQEAVQLPIQFSSLMALCPLRLRTGVLLFGPPGCGKTYAVLAAVKAMHVRLISVKGPELFNKYIGASEAAVRGVFERAASCAPCVLFFDEFEALAPARGHDSTGVSDRVVNQLLTELDGVEGLQGVCVIAASSRPDLIDPALLRPGRLDRWVHCPLPSQTDRKEILHALSRKLHISEEILLGDLAERTEGFTGADLSALLSEAHLNAVNTFLERQPAVEEETPQEIQIGSVDFEAALTSVRPSVSADEIARLEGLYGRFKEDRSEAENKAVLLGNVGRRATLA
ncbi:hypothetical protein BSKO_00891 [Bryopsis sp. KO-2023]|nr:hypothetical protein BSKO_00891 [Bryopsis sp. KO-2023]